MEAKFSKIFTNINLNLNIVETRRFISDLRKDMQIYHDNNRGVITSPDILLDSALNGDMDAQTKFMNLVVLGSRSMPYYSFYETWLVENWNKYRV
jgi:hypothetical protein